MDFETEEQSGPGLSHYLRALRRRWRPAVLTLILVFGLGAAASILLPAQYRSSATILIEQQEIPQDFVRSMITSFASQRIELISQQVMTTNNLLDIVNRYDLYADDRKSKPREVIIERMRENVGMNMISADVVDPRSGRPMQATIAFTVSFTDNRPQTAQRVANELTTLYLNRNLESRTEKASETADFLQAEADRLSDEIAANEAELAVFKEANMNSLPELTQFNMAALDRAEIELREVQRQIRVIEERKIYLESELAQIDPYGPLFTSAGQRILSPTDRIKALSSEIASLSGVYGEQHPALVRRQLELEALMAETGGDAGQLEALGREQAELEGELAALRETYTDAHPAVQRLDRRLESVREQLHEAQSDAEADELIASLAPENPAYIQLATQLDAATTEQDSLFERVAELQAKIAELDARLTATPQIEREYQEFIRQIQNSRMKFTEVRAKELEARLAENLEIGRQGERFTLIEPPLPPQKPVSPNRPMLLAVSLFLGIVASLGFVAVVEMLDTSVRDRDGLEQILGAMPLGAVPAFRTKAELRHARRVRLGATTGAAFAAVLAVYAVHEFYRPLDVIWYVVLRKMGV